MTVREAVQSILGLTGAVNACTCTEGTPGWGIAQAAVHALNRAIQEIYMSPLARHFAREQVSVTFSTTSPVDMAANVLHVIGPATWGGFQPIPLAATETEFNRYHQIFADQHWDTMLWDDLVFASTHNITGSLPWYNVEFYLPLWDDRSILIYFDNAARINALNPEGSTSPRGNPINSRTILVRVELPHADTHDAACRALVFKALNRMAGAFLELEDDVAGGAIRCYRRRAADIADWTASTVTNVFLSVTKGPRVPAAAWAEELKASSGTDLAKVRLHLAPLAAGTVSVYVIKEPPKYTMADVDCDGDGYNSPEIPASHQFSESLYLPLARLAFAQDNPAYLSDQAQAAMPSIEAAAASARQNLAAAAPGASQMTQRNPSSGHAHP